MLVFSELPKFKHPLNYVINNSSIIAGNHIFPEGTNTEVTEIVIEEETIDARFNVQDLESILIRLSGRVRVGPCRECGRIAIYKNGILEHEDFKDKELCEVNSVINR